MTICVVRDVRVGVGDVELRPLHGRRQPGRCVGIDRRIGEGLLLERVEPCIRRLGVGLGGEGNGHGGRPQELGPKVGHSLAAGRSAGIAQNLIQCRLDADAGRFDAAFSHVEPS